MAPGTLANRLTQARAYITFAVYYGFHPLNPSITSICMYIQFLKNSYAAPTTIKNYLSGARTWIVEHGGNVSSFMSFEYRQLTSGLVKRSSHVPSRAAPLTWEHIRVIAAFMDTTPSIPLSAKPCLLIGFHTFLRSGNLLSPTMSTWGGAHTISARDISVCDQGLRISIRSTKTKSDPTPVTAVIPWQDNPVLCPVSSWMKYQHLINPSILGPAFLTDSGLPLTPRHLIGFMRLALRHCKDINPARVSMHSLRRGAAQAAVAAGHNIEQIKQFGMWKSNSGLAPYLI